MTDESADCGCRRIATDDVTFKQVVWCPDHASGCPGPWHPSVIEVQDHPDDDYPDPSEQDEDDAMREEMKWIEAMQECGKVPAAQGGCLMAGTEFCDFECPFRDEDEDE